MESSTTSWPVLPGAYQVGDPQAPVAVCALTSQQLIAPLARMPGVAIAGNVYTANHGIERIVLNVTANPAIRFLLLCGKDAVLFQPAQSLVALGERGLDSERRIVGALGYEPVLPTVAPEQVARFRSQVEIVDWTGEEEVDALAERIGELAARSPGRFATMAGQAEVSPPPETRFVSIRPGGQREPLQYDSTGYFVISLDREQEQIVLRHYLPNHTPAHEMRGRSAGPMLLGLLREGLVSQLSHAGYLGEELAKAQIALQSGWRYSQDRPLRPPEEGELAKIDQQQAATPAGTQPASMPPRMPPIQPALTWAQVQATAPGTTIDVVIKVTELPTANRIAGTVLEPDAADPFSGYHPTQQPFEFRWSPETQVIMGGSADVQVGALLRARGPLGADHVLDVQRLVILTNVAKVIDS